MNTFKDNILYHMHEFYSRLNNLIGVKFQYELDFCNDDLNTYMSHLKEIESKVMNQLQFDDGNVMKNNNNVSMYDNVNTNENGNKVNVSKTVKTTITNKKRSNSKQYRETAGNSVNNTNMNVNTNSSNNNSKLSKYESLLRTPPRDDDYIAPLSGQMDYLKSINEYNTRSRSNYNF